MTVLSEPIGGLIAEAVLYRLDTPQLAAALAWKAAAENRRCFDYLATYRRQGFAPAAPHRMQPSPFHSARRSLDGWRPACMLPT